MPEELIYRSYEARAKVDSESANGTVTATVNVLGAPDSYRSVIMPGAFTRSVLDDFLRNGFVAEGHDWRSPIAMPRTIEAQGRSIVSSAEFHSDPDAQRVRVRCQERMANDLTVGTSIGFSPDWDAVREFSSGVKFLAWADAEGMGDYLDREAIALLDYCWAIPKVTRLFEWSIATVPSNPGSLAASVRSLLGDGGRSGLTLSQHLDSALAAVSGALSRYGEYREMREGDGRRVSPERLTQVRELAAKATELARACETEPPAVPDIDPDRSNALRSTLLRMTA